jgi:hypothetical protein
MVEDRPPAGGEPPRIEGRSPFRLAMERFRKDKVAMASVGFILVLALFALAAPLVAKATGHPPNNQSHLYEMTTDAGLPKGPNPELKFYFGADQFGRDVAPAIAVITAGLIVAGASPAFAPYTRQAANAVNVTEACPRYLSLKVARQVDPVAPQAQGVAILVFEVKGSSQTPGRQVLNGTVRVRPVDPFLQPLLPNDWDTGRLAPGTRLLVGPPDVFGPEPQAPPIEVTISPR